MEDECGGGSRETFPIRFLNTCNLQLVLAFLDGDSIMNIIRAGETHPHSRSAFLSIARVTSFIRNYLNLTDRSIYMPFYSQPLFANIERQQLAHLSTQHSPGFCLLSGSCRDLLAGLRGELEGFGGCEEVLASVVQSLTDPQLPFPKLRKQDIGMHCNSSFQFFLVNKLFPSGQEQMEQAFQELSSYLSQQWAETGFGSEQQIQLIEEVYEEWFKISYENYQQYILPNNTHHNLIVLLVALLDLFVDSFNLYIQSIDDPFYRFVEFNMRFCVFRNMLLSLEDKLGFLFKNYSLFCKQVLKQRSSNKMEPEGSESEEFREMTLWHCGLSKWYIYMQQLHASNFKTFFYILKKTNLHHIKQNNVNHMHEHATFIQLQNRLELSEFDLLDRENTFEMHSAIEDIFDMNPELYDQVIKEYGEYIVDISINQYSVHWCGHSSHVLHVPYQEFELSMVEAYQGYIEKIGRLAGSVSCPAVALDNMLRAMISQLDKEYLKPVSLKKIVDLAKDELIKLSGEDHYQRLEFCLAVGQISEEIGGRDKILDHFNNNAGISNEINYVYSIVLQNQDFNKMLKTSASTNASSSSPKRLPLPKMPKMCSIRSSDSIMEQDLV